MHKSGVASLKQWPEIILPKTSPAKAVEPGGKFVNLEENACLNLKLWGEKYFMNIHKGCLAEGI